MMKSQVCAQTLGNEVGDIKEIAHGITALL